MNWTKGERWEAEDRGSGQQGTGENEGLGSSGLFALASLSLYPYLSGSG